MLGCKTWCLTGTNAPTSTAISGGQMCTMCCPCVIYTSRENKVLIITVFLPLFFETPLYTDNFTIIHCFYSRRTLAATFNFRVVGLTHIFLRLLALPVFHLLLWIFYSGMEDYQRTFITRNGLIFNCLAGAYFVSIIVTVCTCKFSLTVQQRNIRNTIIISLALYHCLSWCHIIPYKDFR